MGEIHEILENNTVTKRFINELNVTLISATIKKKGNLIEYENHVKTPLVTLVKIVLK